MVKRRCYNNSDYKYVVRGFEMTRLNQMPSSYDEFLLQNRKYINASFLYIILTCTFTGPAIGLGIYAGIFTHTSYGACVIISVA